MYCITLIAVEEGMIFRSGVYDPYPNKLRVFGVGGYMWSKSVSSNRALYSMFDQIKVQVNSTSFGRYTAFPLRCLAR